MRTPHLLALITLVMPSAAQACGGFFCGQTQPVDQKGEEIFFAMDQAAGTVEMHVKIEYQGPAEEFAWVLPAPADPALAIGSDAFFDQLSTLRAQFFLNRDLGDCAVPMASSTASSSAGGGDGGVNVIRKGLVGPYETVTLQAKDSTELVDWLQTNQFYVPDAIDPKLAPYISEGGYFVALRLAKDKDSGDIEPLVMTYQGTEAAIPIQLTSIAATPDMRLRVYVAGAERAVPDSYLHVQLNHLAVDWWTGGANLDDAITAAADEAGGHAFFTDYSGSTDRFRDRLFRADWDSVDWAAQPTVSDVFQRIAEVQLQVDENLSGLLADHTGLPEEGGAGLNITQLLNCHNANAGYGYYWYGSYPENCWSDALDTMAFDHALFADDLEAIYLEPRRRVDQLVKSHPTITRMTSSVSPVEMTVDPTFVFNPDMGPVEQARFADEVWFCRDGDLFTAPRELHLADGRVVSIPSTDFLSDLGISEFEWLESKGLTTPAAAIIEDTSSSGDPTIVVDNTDLLAGALADYERDLRRNCGCVQTGGAAGWMVFLPALALLRRRRD